MIGQIILQLVLIALNAVFACAEIAVLSMNENKLAKMASEGNKKALKLQKLTSQPASFLATIQVAITLSGFLGSAFAADNFSEVIVKGLLSLGIPVPQETLNTISVIVITILLSFITLVFGELVPKRVAMRKTESIALALAGTVSFISKAFSPLVWLLTASTNGVLRLMGIDPNAEDSEVSEEDIRMMADAGTEKGVINEDENNIIQNIFEFNDIYISEIMTHRTELVMLWMEDGIEQWMETIKGNTHIFYPICEETADRVVGVLDSRKFLRLEEKTKENALKKAIDKPYFVSGYLKANELFREMKKNNCYFSVVVDEFGGTDGIVSINDLIEEIIGEFENIQSEIKKLDDSTYKIDCSVEISKVERILKVNIESNAVTLNGWIIEQFSAVPKVGYEFDYDKFKFRVTESNEKQVVSVIVTAKTENE
ncbi:MAG: hemolysin family protein [Acutalibacteraceae bacterium]|nr:hemolysin family protein [Acutalibacteraceae bacterium]